MSAPTPSRSSFLLSFPDSRSRSSRRRSPESLQSASLRPRFPSPSTPISRPPSPLHSAPILTSSTPLGRSDEPLPPAGTRRRQGSFTAYPGRLAPLFLFLYLHVILAHLPDTFVCAPACQDVMFVLDAAALPQNPAPANNTPCPGARQPSLLRHQAHLDTLRTQVPPALPLFLCFHRNANSGEVTP